MDVGLNRSDVRSDHVHVAVENVRRVGRDRAVVEARQQVRRGRESDREVAEVVIE